MPYRELYGVSLSNLSYIRTTDMRLHTILPKADRVVGIDADEIRLAVTCLAHT